MPEHSQGPVLGQRLRTVACNGTGADALERNAQFFNLMFCLLVTVEFCSFTSKILSCNFLCGFETVIWNAFGVALHTSPMSNHVPQCSSTLPALQALVASCHLT